MDPDRPCVKPSWSASLKMLSGGNFLQCLQNFNKDTINDEVVELLQPYFEMPDYTLGSCEEGSLFVIDSVYYAGFFPIRNL